MYKYLAFYLHFSMSLLASATRFEAERGIKQFVFKAQSTRRSYQGRKTQLVERRTAAPLAQVRFPGGAKDSSLLAESPFTADSFTLSVHPRVQSHAFTSVRSLKILSSMSEFGGLRKYWTIQACIVGWVARLCRSWLSPGKATRISDGRNPTGTILL